MKKLYLFFVFLAIVNTSSCTTSYKAADKIDSSFAQKLKKSHPSVVYLSGDAKEIGQNYGQYFKKDATYLINNWLNPRMSQIPNGGKRVAIKKLLSLIHI